MSKLEERDMTGGDRAIPSSWGSCTNQRTVKNE
jgi:hypothetical protein